MNKSTTLYDRYQRQIILKNFGEAGQQKLLAARVLVVGAGGLGCPALQYLAAAGIGNIGVVDDDTVALHNLHRQVLFTNADLGKPKALTAAAHVGKMNPAIEVQAYQTRLTNTNALKIIAAYDIVLDGSDNFATRYLINDACVLLHKTLVYGGVAQFEGQVAVFNAGEHGLNYRDAYAAPPKNDTLYNCSETGVLGVLPGIIGTMQATEVIKMVTGIGKPLINRLFTYNALNNESYVFEICAQNSETMIPKTTEAFERFDYNGWCSEVQHIGVDTISAEAFPTYFERDDVLIADIREAGEIPLITAFEHLKIPSDLLQARQDLLKRDTIILFCQTGKRSREAAQKLAATFGNQKKIYSLEGGIINWQNNLHG